MIYTTLISFKNMQDNNNNNNNNMMYGCVLKVFYYQELETPNMKHKRGNLNYGAINAKGG